MFPFLLVYGLFGLVVGSFLNVCIYRIPRGESIVFPGSHCPNCGERIRPWDNVPVLAYLWLRGRCRSCRARISLQYPAVELLNAAAWAACGWNWDFTPPTFVNSLLLSLLLSLFFIDYQHQILPDAITYPGAAAGFLLSPLQTPQLFADSLTARLAAALAPGNLGAASPWIGSLLGAAVGAGILLAVGSAYKAVRGKQGLGMGDVKMMLLVGAFLGWRQAVLTIFSGAAIGALGGVFLILFGGRTLQSRLAFGTFLGVGAVLALFLGPTFYDWYFDLR